MQIRKAHKSEFGKIKKIYLEAFPLKERKPFRVIRQGVNKGQFEVLGIIDKGRMVGLAISMLHEDMVLLDYFAVHKDYRGMGYGSGAINQLRKRYADRRFFLEIEEPDEHSSNHIQRQKRRQFYLRNGMTETGIHVKLFEVPMEVLSDGKSLTFAQYHSVQEAVMGQFFSKRVIKA